MSNVSYIGRKRIKWAFLSFFSFFCPSFPSLLPSLVLSFLSALLSFLLSIFLSSSLSSLSFPCFPPYVLSFYIFILSFTSPLCFFPAYFLPFLSFSSSFLPSFRVLFLPNFFFSNSSIFSYPPSLLPGCRYTEPLASLISTLYCEYLKVEISGQHDGRQGCVSSVVVAEL